MAQAKLLCILIMLSFGQIAFADEMPKKSLIDNQPFKGRWRFEESQGSEGPQKQEEKEEHYDEYFKDSHEEKVTWQEQIKARYPGTVAEEDANLFIFVSSSMSPSLIKQYIKEASRYGGSLIFNGFVGDDFKVTKEYFIGLKLDEEEMTHIMIDSRPFKLHKITQVPSIVLQVQDDENIVSDKISGNVSIKYALSKFAEEGEAQDAAAKLLTH